jgi:protein O-mannosyl-transferase
MLKRFITGGKSSLVWLVLVITFLLYLPTLGYEFVLYDDDLHLYENPYLQLPLHESIFFFWSKSYSGFFIPVTYTVWAILAQWSRTISGALSPAYFHTANIVLHLLNAVLVFLLIKRFHRGIDVTLAAFWGALFFAVHPLQVESVAWATGLKDLLATFFVLIASHQFLRALEEFSIANRFFFSGVIFYLLGILSKPSVAPLPAVLLILSCFLTTYSKRRLIKASAIWILSAIPLIAKVAGLQPVEFAAYVVPAWAKPFVAADTMTFYLGKLAVPFPLVYDYARSPESVIASKAYLVTTALLFFLIVFATKVKPKVWLGCLIGFILALSPVLGFVQFSFQKYSTVADHYMYFPMVVLSMAVALAVMRSAKSKKISWAFSVYFFILVLFSFRQMNVWRNTETLFAHTLAHQPQSILTLNNLAILHERKGEWQEALRMYERSLEAGPRMYPTYCNLGQIYLRLQRFPEASEYFLKTLKIQPNYPEAHYGLGLIAEAKGDLFLARNHYETALQQAPGMKRAQLKLDRVLGKLGKRR